MPGNVPTVNILESRKALGVPCGNATFAIRSRDTQQEVLEIGEDLEAKGREK